LAFFSKWRQIAPFVFIHKTNKPSNQQKTDPFLTDLFPTDPFLPDTSPPDPSSPDLSLPDPSPPNLSPLDLSPPDLSQPDPSPPYHHRSTNYYPGPITA
jgi:hypothetical protein